MNVHFCHFFKEKKWKSSHETVGINVFYCFCLMIEGSGSVPLIKGSGAGSRRTKNIWIRRIRIRNTGTKEIFFSCRLRSVTQRCNNTGRVVYFNSANAVFIYKTKIICCSGPLLRGSERHGEGSVEGRSLSRGHRLWRQVCTGIQASYVPRSWRQVCTFAVASVVYPGYRVRQCCRSGSP